MSEARVARDSLSERSRPVEREPLEQLLGALVNEPEAGLEVHDGLAFAAEAELSGLDDPRMDRSDGDLEDALALDPSKRERFAGVGEVRARHRVAAQWVIARRPVLVEGESPEIGVSQRHEAEQIVNLALEAAGREG